MWIIKKAKLKTVVKEEVKQLDKTVYEQAVNGENGYVLIPANKADINHTVEVVEPRTEVRGMVVCKRK